MGDLENGGLSFDLLAASIRADAADMRTFLEALAAKLEGALPGEVQVRRRGGLFHSAHEVESLTVHLGDHRFELTKRGTALEPAVRNEVRGITLKTERVELDEWIELLARRLHEHAESSAQARAALEKLVL